MAAGAWVIPTQTKKLLGAGSIALGSGVFRLCLVKSGATLPSEGLSATTWGSLLTDGVTEMGSTGGYVTSGLSLASVVWTISGSSVKFDCVDFSLSASANLSDARFAVIRVSVGDRVLCYSQLSSAGFDLSSGNKLTITMNSAGIFNLN